GTETDASKTSCLYCGKIIIAEKLVQTPKRRDEGNTSDSFDEMAKKLDDLDDDDLFGDLQPLGDSLKEDTARTSQTSEDGVEELLPPEEFDKPKKFVNPMAKSNIMKKLADDQDLFGSLDK
ncbi:MAG: hypothetical protein ACXAE3_03900, partial [Candidatus Kariarchaeaceae archaeon]